MAQQNYVEAIAAYRQAATLGLDAPATRIRLGVAYAYAGQDDRGRAILEDLRTRQGHVSSTELAILYAALSERERAFTLLEAAYRARALHHQ
jgi:tetratricopeptide (TPR) repeat protein